MRLGHYPNKMRLGHYPNKIYEKQVHESDFGIESKSICTVLKPGCILERRTSGWAAVPWPQPPCYPVHDLLSAHAPLHLEYFQHLQIVALLSLHEQQHGYKHDQNLIDQQTKCFGSRHFDGHMQDAIVGCMIQPCEPPGTAQKQPAIGFGPAAAGVCIIPCYWCVVRKSRRFNGALDAEAAIEAAISSREWRRFSCWELPCCRSEIGAQHLAGILDSAPSRPPAARETSRSVDRAQKCRFNPNLNKCTDIGTTSQGWQSLGKVPKP
jgi:hypothetical protein